MYYCGSNALHHDLVQNGGNKIIGTRYKCLKKGIGQGLSMPYDKNYNNNYEPIDPRVFYCGDKDELPNGYDLNGTLQQCFMKGIGFGRRQKAIKTKKSVKTKKSIKTKKSVKTKKSKK